MRIFKATTYFALCIITISCAMTHSLQRQTPTADIKLPGNGSVETPEVEDIERAVEQIRRVSMNGGIVCSWQKSSAIPSEKLR